MILPAIVALTLQKLSLNFLKIVPVNGFMNDLCTERRNDLFQTNSTLRKQKQLMGAVKTKT